MVFSTFPVAYATVYRHSHPAVQVGRAHFVREENKTTYFAVAGPAFQPGSIWYQNIHRQP